MIPTYVNHIAVELQDRLGAMGYSLIVEHSGRDRVAMRLDHPRRPICFSVNHHETCIWLELDSVCMDGMGSDYCMVSKKRGLWGCNCGAEICLIPRFFSRRELLEEIFIRPILEIFENIGGGDFLDFYVINDEMEGLTCASFRRQNKLNLEGMKLIDSIWIAPRPVEQG